jgi:two-component system alkaline phosphatase synthesis response regulator PhoP
VTYFRTISLTSIPAAHHLFLYQDIMTWNNRVKDKAPNHPKSASILIVEDEKLIGWSVSRFLQKAGFMVNVVETGEKAMEKIRSQKFCLVLTDLHVPLCGGIKVAENVKSINSSIYVVLMSSSLLSSDEREEYGKVVDAIIEKPVNFEDFLLMVNKFINKSGCGK